MVFDEESCKICGATFKAGTVKDGKCPECTRLYPKAKSREDIRPKDKSPIAQLLSEARVEEIVLNVLEQVGIVKVACAKCGTKFFAKSPNQKYCESCKGENK